MIHIRRVYEAPSPEDGLRVLVDRLWPRGLSKAEAHIDLWLKELAPSNELRRWFGHDPAKWEEFKARYFADLEAQPELVQRLLQHSRGGTLTLLYSAKEPRFNNATALLEYLAQKS
jgi:uncharacterized protein YeaO (DUF488 family)